MYDGGVLSAGRGWPARTPCAFLIRALPVPASRCGVCCLPLIGPRICRRVGGTRDKPVEALFPQSRERFELGSSGWSWILGIDAVGGAPYCDFADEGGARVASRRCPDWLGVTFAGAILDLVGEVGDQLGSLCKVGPPDGMGMQRWWSAREPRQRTWVGRRELGEAPVEDGRHFTRSTEVASAGRCQHVAQWMFSCFGGEGE